MGLFMVPFARLGAPPGFESPNGEAAGPSPGVKRGQYTRPGAGFPHGNPRKKGVSGNLTGGCGPSLSASSIPTKERMKSPLRRACLPIFAACLTGLASLASADPTPTPAAAAPAAKPAVAPAPAPASVNPPGPKVTPLQLPKALEGVVTLDEFTALIKFQQGLRENPDIAAINTQIRGKMTEITELQKQAQAVQQKELEAHPDIKAISDKIKAHRPK